MTKSKTISYTAQIEAGERPTVRISSADGDEVFAFRLPTREDVRRFVRFLNDNQIEAVHVKDCFRDFVFVYSAEL